MPAKTLSERLRLWLVVAALLVALFLLIRAIVAPDVKAWSWPFVPKEDGTWRAVMLDGKHVPTDMRYQIDIDSGLIHGGFDLCRNWGFQNPSKPREGLTADANECLRVRQSLDDSYWALVPAKPKMVLMSGETLRLEASGHSGLFQRAAENGDGR
jgi:hypothetical protein